VIPSFKKNKNHISKFKKLQKNLDIVNDDKTYNNAKFQYEILCIVGYTKMTKIGNLYRFENICTQILHAYHFCVSQNI
jgi:hypothetical protein